MRFLAPHWLYALAILPLVFIVFMLDERGREKRFAKFIGKALWGRLVPELDPKAKRRKLFTWLAAMAFLFLALARPQWGTHEEVVHASGLDVMIALDISNSMNVEDVAPSRLLKAKHLIRTLAERLQGDRVGLVSFAGSGYLACPLTTDTEYLLEQLSIQTPKLLATQGTDIGIGLEAAVKALDRGSEEGDHHEQSSEPTPTQASRVIILVTDGEDFEGHAAEAAEQLKNEGVKLYIFGVGTQKGGPIPVRDEDGTLRGYKKDHSGQAVLSAFNPEAMTQLASAAGGQYWNASGDEGEVTDLLKDMGALHQGELAEHRYLTYEERFQYPLAIAIFLFLIELSLAARKRTTAFVFALLFFWLPKAHAAAPVDAYLENQKGIDAYKKGQIEEARKRFGSAQALDPAAPELQYNQGLVQLEGGDPDAAIQDFKDAAQGAAKTGNSGLAGRSLFNLGTALTKKGDIQGAIQSYLATIDAAHRGNPDGKPDSKSEQLETDARKNIELLIQQKQKQKQQDQKQDQKQQQQRQQQQQNQDQKQEQQQQKGGNDQQKDQEKSQDKGQDQKPQQQQQEQQQKQDQGQQGKQQQEQYDTRSGNRNFKSEKLSEEDAERVMAELKNKERDLQMRQAIKKQNANRENDYKDW